MWNEALTILSSWSRLDTWIVVTGALAAMGCALPGNFLVVRRQSMMGDAISHTVLPGIVAAFLIGHWLETGGWLAGKGDGRFAGVAMHAALFAGAMISGVLAALLTEWIEKQGRVESSAALGVVFTSLFALGLLLIRATADSVHIDPDCVLYGTIETVVMDTLGTTAIPRAAVVNGAVLGVNLLLVGLFYKELLITAFDPALAAAQGIPARAVHYGLMAITAATLVAAFESVGSILVIAMLIVPAVTAYLLTDRFSVMIGLSLVIAASSAVLGHVAAIVVPPIVFSRLGFHTVVDASTAGMMAAAAGGLFALALVLSPREGVLSRVVGQGRLRLRIAAEDVLGVLFRREEQRGAELAAPAALHRGGVERLATLWLEWRGELVRSATGYVLTEAGRNRARELVRAHRLWESYMARHFTLPGDHLHETAERVEHFIGHELQDRLAGELERPEQDPHGRSIPS